MRGAELLRRASWIGVGTVGAIYVRSPALTQSDAREPQFRFGVIADIQYCDCDTATNFAGTEVRNYRGTLAQAQDAVALWNSMGVQFVVQLGDLIDGQNAGGYGAGLKFEEPQSEQALSRVASALAGSDAPIYHAIGNHELYNFDWKGLVARLQLAPGAGCNGAEWTVARAQAGLGKAAAATGEDEAGPGKAAGATGEDFYYSWRPAAGWTFVMLNAYAVSVEQDAHSPGYREAATVLARRNPRCFDALMSGRTQGINFFEGLERDEDLRYVPFNGGLGTQQLKWLRAEVRAASERGDRIVVLTHVPLLAEAASPRTLVYDSEAALEILHDEGRGQVVAVLAGHLHRGGYACDSAHIHHVTIRSPLSFERCFGYMEAYPDRLELVGSGEEGLQSRTLRFRTAPP